MAGVVQVVMHKKQNDKAEDGLNREERAAMLIGRAWRRKCEGGRTYLDRKNLIERLFLEDAVCVGVIRLVLFIIIFVLLINTTQFGTSASEKSAVNTLLQESLGLEDLEALHRLADIRSALRPFSTKIKTFSASGSIRFPEEEAMMLIQAEENFLHPRPVKGLDLDVTGDQFTFVAWVRVDPTSHHHTSIIRKPLSTNPAVSCWGWYFPAEFHYGAHDFHRIHMEESGMVWEDQVSGSHSFPPDALNHMALVVNTTADKVHTAEFFLNGVPVHEPVVIPRAVTDCVGTIELGGDHIGVSNMKFYPRALPANEIVEMIERGQPLSEIATGSVLHDLTGNPFNDLQIVIEESRDHTEEMMIEKNEEMALSDALALYHLAESEAVAHAALFTDDFSPAACLHPDEPYSGLPHEELHLWEHDYHHKRALNETITDEWRVDTVSGAGSYWSAFEDPIYSRPENDPEADVAGKNHDKNPLVKLNFTGVDPNTEVITVAFWVRAVDPENKFSMVFRFGNYSEYDILGYHLLSYGGEVLRVTNPTTDHTWHQTQPDMFAAYQVYGPLDEKLFITAFNHEPEPTVWRFITVVMYIKDGYHKSYLDGRLVKTTDWHGIHDITIAHLQGKSLTIDQSNWYSTGKIMAKVAQFRMYPRELEQNVIAKLQANAVWPGGQPIKQCFEIKDNTFHDSSDVDSEGRNCAWYHEQMLKSSLVCHSAAVKTMCPLTCRGKRECNTGYPYDGHIHDYDTEHDTDHHHVYRMWDRILHLQPKHDDHPTILCPGKSQKKETLVSQCKATNSTYTSIAEGEFPISIEHAWEGYHRADIRDCDVLDNVQDDDQCAWDDSWLPQFVEEFHTKKKFSLTFWSKPSPNSRGMPDEFVHAVNFFSTIVPPRTLLDIKEQHPYQEATTRLAIPIDDGHESLQMWSDIRHGGYAKFHKGWTFYYVSFAQLANGQWEQCLAINGFAQVCSHYGDFGAHPGYITIPDTFLAAVEVTAEVIITPIEWSTDILAASEIQERYYMTYPRMKTVLGPRITEVEYQEALTHQSDTDISEFPERIMLAAPPLLYQSRRKTKENCTSDKAMLSFREAQLELVLGTHCTIEGSCEHVKTVNDVYACKGGDDLTTNDQFYGLNQSLNFDTPVYADFLYTIADNDVITRNGAHGVETLETGKFLDAETDSAKILCLFHSPDTGDTTVLDISFTFEGSKVSVETSFTHFGFLTSSVLADAKASWGGFFALCAITLVVNFMIWYNLLEEAKLYPEVGLDKKAFAEIIYDIFQVAVLLVYGVVKFGQQERSEAEAETLIGQFADVPFRDPQQSVQSKVNDFFDAVVTMNQLLAEEEQMKKIGFFVMLLMLIRIINATAVHPRTGVLIGTMREGLNDLWHFAILFLIIFYFFSQVSFWSFNDRAQFGDQSTAMVTQFEILLGSLPEDFDNNWLLIIYVVLTNVIMFFLMLNFLLAIVVEAYMKVREHIEECQTENEITYDLGLTLYFTTMGTWNGWPNRRVIAFLMQNRLARRNVSWTELHVLGVPSKPAQAFIKYYSKLDALEQTSFITEIDMDSVAETCSENLKKANSNTAALRQLERNVEGLSRGMELLLKKQLGDAYDPTILRAEVSQDLQSYMSKASRPVSAIKGFMSTGRPTSSKPKEISWDKGDKGNGAGKGPDDAVVETIHDDAPQKQDSRGSIKMSATGGPNEDQGTRAQNNDVVEDIDLPGQTATDTSPVRVPSQSVDDLVEEIGITGSPDLKKPED